MPKASAALSVLLAIALVASASVGGVALLDATSTATTPVEGVSENTTRVLRLDQVQASGFGAPRVVVVDAATAQEADLDVAVSLASVERRLEEAPNATVRRTVLRNATEAAATDVRSLQAAERDARQAYADGDITAAEYGQRLALIHARAEALQRLLGSTASPRPSLWSYTAAYGDIQDRIDFLREELEYLTGPVRAEMAAAVSGEREPVRVFLAAGPNGFELSYLRTDGVYVRSAYRADNIDDDPAGARSPEPILRIAPALYPWAIGENLSGPGNLAATPITAHGTIRTTIQHPHGRVLAHVDETTEQVYYEVQHKRLDALPVEYAHRNTTDGTSVRVSRTYPGGPLQVSVLDVSDDNETGYVGVPVTVNDTTRNTGADGRVWFISPQGSYNVTTTANSTDFRFNVTAA